MRHVQEDVMEEKIERARCTQDCRSFHLPAELRPCAPRIPADVLTDVVHVDGKTNYPSEEQPWDKRNFYPRPCGTSESLITKPPDKSNRRGRKYECRQHLDPATIDFLRPFFWRGKHHHLVPPHLATVIEAGADGRPLDFVSKALPARHRVPLREGDRVPDEVHTLFDGVAMVHTVVSEIPRLLEVCRWEHRDARDDFIQAPRFEQRPVRGVVAQHEQPAYCEASN